MLRQFARPFAVALVVLLFGSILTLVPQKSASGVGSAPVTVVNTTPIAVTGTLTGTVSGTVGATQTGAWNVGITGTPSVNVATLPAVQLQQATGPLAVSNPTNQSNQAVPLSVSDGNAFHSFHASCVETSGEPGFCSFGSLFQGGQELVIEQVTGHVPGAPPGTVPLILNRVYLEAGLKYDLPTFLTGMDVGISTPVRIRVDGLTQLQVVLVGNCPCNSTFSLSGYTVSTAQQ